jgi:hypothetical protein
MGRALSCSERDYVAGLDREWRRYFWAVVRDNFGERGLAVFDDSWQQVLLTVGCALVEGEWVDHWPRWKVRWHLGQLLREARRVVKTGRVGGGDDARRPVMVHLELGWWAGVLLEQFDEYWDGVEEPFDWGVYLIRSAIAQLGDVSRRTMEDFVELVESGELAERQQRDGLYVMLEERAARRGEVVSRSRLMGSRLEKGRLKLWGLLRARGLVSGSMPKRVLDRHCGPRRGKRASSKRHVRLRTL